MYSTSHSEAAHRYYTFSIIGIFLVAILSRVFHAFVEDSMWIDELMLSSSVVNRSILGLFNNLEFNQGAPPFFLICSKISTLIFGVHDWALKLPSYIISIFGCILFWVISHNTLKRTSACLALLLFTLNTQILDYSQIFKPYIFDVFFLIAGVYIYLRLTQEPNRLKFYIIFALFGMIATWFSYPSIFTLAGLGTACIYIFMVDRNYKAMRGMGILMILWLISFIPLYIINIRKVFDNKADETYWEPGFLIHTDGLSGIFTWVQNIATCLAKLGTLPNLLVGILLILGIYNGIRKHRTFTLGIIAITSVAIVFSALNFYSLYDRLSLFLVPIVIWICAIGLNSLFTCAQKTHKLAHSLLIVAILVLLFPQFKALSQKHVSYQQMRQALEFVGRIDTQNVPVYVFSDAIHGIQFYGPSLQLKWEDYILVKKETLDSLFQYASGQTSDASLICCVWGRRAKLGTIKDFMAFFSVLNNQAVDYRLFAFNNSYVLLSSPQINTSPEIIGNFHSTNP